MRTSLTVLDNLQVASPCHVDWNEMAGDDKSRFCGQCEKHVYNLSAMTTEAALDLVREKEGNLCVRFYRRHDGTMLTTDCPVGVHHRIRRRKRTAGVFASIASLLFMTGCAREDGPDTQPDETLLQRMLGKPAPNPAGMVMGEPALVHQGGTCGPPPAPVPLAGPAFIPAAAQQDGEKPIGKRNVPVPE